MQTEPTEIAAERRFAEVAERLVAAHGAWLLFEQAVFDMPPGPDRDEMERLRLDSPAAEAIRCLEEE